jgi:hypothetical protein
MFLTAKTPNLIIVGLLPSSLMEQVTQVFWLQCSIISLIVVVLGHFLSDRLIYGNLSDRPLPIAIIETQSRLLGPLGQLEWVALVFVSTFIIAASTTSLHHLSLSTISTLMLVSLLLYGAVTKVKFQKKIDWSMLFYLLAIDSISSILRSLDVTGYMSDLIRNFGLSLSGNHIYFILFEYAVISVIRLVLPITATMIVASILLIPFSSAVGIHPFLIGFMASLFSDAWFFPYQASHYLQFKSKEGGSDGSYDERLFVQHNALLTIFKLFSALLSLPFWIWLGLI